MPGASPLMTTGPAEFTERRLDLLDVVSQPCGKHRNIVGGQYPLGLPFIEQGTRPRAGEQIGRPRSRRLVLGRSLDGGRGSGLPPQDAGDRANALRRPSKARDRRQQPRIAARLLGAQSAWRILQQHDEADVRLIGKRFDAAASDCRIVQAGPGEIERIGDVRLRREQPRQRLLGLSDRRKGKVGALRGVERKGDFASRQADHRHPCGFEAMRQRRECHRGLDQFIEREHLDRARGEERGIAGFEAAGDGTGVGGDGLSTPGRAPTLQDDHRLAERTRGPACGDEQLGLAQLLEEHEDRRHRRFVDERRHIVGDRGDGLVAGGDQVTQSEAARR